MSRISGMRGIARGEAGAVLVIGVLDARFVARWSLFLVSASRWILPMFRSIVLFAVLFAATTAAAAGRDFEIAALGGVGFGGSTDLEFRKGSLDTGVS